MKIVTKELDEYGNNLIVYLRDINNNNLLANIVTKEITFKYINSLVDKYGIIYKEDTIKHIKYGE